MRAKALHRFSAPIKDMDGTPAGNLMGFDVKNKISLEIAQAHASQTCD